MWRSGRSVFETEGTAEAKALRQDCDEVCEEEERGRVAGVTWARKVG